MPAGRRRTGPAALFAGSDVGQGRRFLRAERLGAEHPALDDQVLVALGEVLQCLGDEHRITGAVLGNEGDGRGSREHVVELESELSRREAHERVLVDLVVATGGPQRPAERRDVGHGDAAVFGEQRSLAAFEPFADLVDHGDLLRSRLGSGVVHRTSFRLLGHRLDLGRATGRCLAGDGGTGVENDTGRSL